MILLAMEMMALEAVVRVSCLMAAAFVDDADIVVVGESKRGDMDDEFDDDGVSNDD